MNLKKIASIALCTVLYAAVYKDAAGSFQGSL